MSPLLYDSNSWRSKPEVKSLSLNASPTIWQWLMKVNTGSEITDLECLPYYMTGLMKANTGSEITVLVCLHYLYDRGSWKSTMEVKSPSLNASPNIWRGLMKSTPEVKSLSLNAFSTIWQRLMKVNTGSEITVLESPPYYMTEAHEFQHWKWNNCPRMLPLLYDIDSWRSTLEVKSLSLNSSPTIWQWLMRVTTGSEIILLECPPPPPAIWQRLVKVNTRSEITVL